jgi:diphosphomevalonate decarboxylase
MRALARAHVNIALVKYWGKLPGPEKLPSTGSLSLTLDALYTETAVAFEGGEGDSLTIDGAPASPDALARAAKVLARVRELSGERRAARVESRNAVPAGEGLASSASAFAALATAAAKAAGLALTPAELSALARLGSGSAARSIFGGFCKIPEAARESAEPLAAPGLSPCLVVARLAPGPKEISSSEGMRRTEETSPYYRAWVEAHAADLREAEAAISAGALARLGAVTERNALRMHAAALAADPGVLYFRGPTVEAILAIRGLRKAGTPAYFTADAGAHPIALCDPKDAVEVATRLAAVPGVIKTLIGNPGPAASVIEHWTIDSRQ